MANDIKLDIKRLNYFTGQFLEAVDFSDEQSYHIAMRRRLNASLRGPGILDGGFKVKVKNQATTTEPAIITVGAGIGVDNQGRELVILSLLAKEIPKSELSNFLNKTVAIYLVYKEEQTDNKADNQEVTSGYTRWTEKPDIILQLHTDSAPTDSIRLEDITVDNEGIISSLDEPVRQVANLFVDGNVGIGTRNPSCGVEINKGATNDLALRLTSSGAGWGSGIQFQNSGSQGKTYGMYSDNFTGSLRIADVNKSVDRLVIDKDGNVGIGTSSPSSGLEINKGATNDLALRLTSSGSGWGSGIQFQNSGSQGKTYGIYSGNAGSLHISDENKSVDRLVIDKDGNVGIGTSTPEEMLSVQTGLNVDQANTNAGTLQPGISFGNNSGEGIASRRSSGVNQYGLDFYAGGAARFSITNRGFVGIGTTTPQRPLHLSRPDTSAEIIMELSNAAPNYRQWNFVVNAPRPGAPSCFHIRQKKDDINEGGNVPLTITDDCTVHINKLDVAEILAGQLNVDQANANVGNLKPGISFGSSNSGEGIASRRSSGVNQYGLDFYAGGAARLSITNGGNVGIGTFDIKRTLHVEGSEIHSGGAAGGFSFSDRTAPTFLDQPSAGQRWVWYAANGTARLWSGSDKLSITADGNVDIGSNPVRFSSGWTGSPDAVVNRAEISNDTGIYKTLMIIGNKSAGLGRRVSVWDRLEVNGTMLVNGTTLGTGEIQTTSANAFRMVYGNYGIFFRNDGDNTYLFLTNAGDPYGGWNDLRPLRINNTSGEIYLSNLDVGDNFTATIRCGDFCMGHSARRGTPGRALVDFSNTLHLNYGADWANVSIGGRVSTPSSRQLKENIQTLPSQLAKQIISTLEPVSFNYKHDSLKSPCLGFIAEDAPTEVASSNYDAIIMNHIVTALTRVVKDQEQSIAELAVQINLLRNKNT